jgi:hypothetical protein
VSSISWSFTTGAATGRSVASTQRWLRGGAGATPRRSHLCEQWSELDPLWLELLVLDPLVDVELPEDEEPPLAALAIAAPPPAITPTAATEARATPTL